MKALEYLKSKEWSMGNGQCPECYGLSPSFHGSHKAREIGHRDDCELANSLIELGGTALIIGDYKPDIDYENYITDAGFLGWRPKTKEGCPKLKAMFRQPPC